MNTKVPLSILYLGLIYSLLGFSINPNTAYADQYSTNETGIIGLNLNPSARMDTAGTIRLGAGTSDPYLHGFLGFQITNSVYASIRQTAEFSNFSDPSDRVYPGIDLKFKIRDETQFFPQIALGFDAAFGHKKLASEYIVLSKKYNNFDFTTGLAWGRLGSGGGIKNPLSSISSHFEEERIFHTESSQSFDDWFTGEEIGIFGGIEYFTPLNGFSVKAEYGSNDYEGTKNINQFNAPSPWSIGFNYKPWEYTDLSAAVIGGEKIMARLSIQGNTPKWTKQTTNPNGTLYIKPNDNLAVIHLSGASPTAQEIGHVIKEQNTNSITSINLQHKGLRGPNLTLLGNDIQRIKESTTTTSPDEIWHNTEVANTSSKTLYKKQPSNFRLLFDTQLSLAEDETGPLYRSSFIASYERPTFLGFHLGITGRVNLANNLNNLTILQKTQTNVPNIREDEQAFADRRLSLDRFYTNWRGNLTNNLYTSASIGYLEEMFSGYGGEILYRPFGKTFAIGAEAWRVAKRDPFTDLNLGTTSEEYTTAHINAFYEIPNKNTTIYSSIGQYLGEDFGITTGLRTQFKNGVTLNGFITATDEEDTDIFGETSSLYSGIQLNLPLGKLPYIPNGSTAKLNVSPFNRNFGQRLNKPIDLYETTEPFSYRQIHQSWPTLLD